MNNDYLPIPLKFERQSSEDMIKHAQDYYESIKTRRSIRDFTDESIPEEVIATAIRAAGTAPNGANMQPWHFSVVSNPEVKRKIRLAAEEEERAFYDERASEEWLDALSHLGTDAEKTLLRDRFSFNCHLFKEIQLRRRRDKT